MNEVLRQHNNTFCSISWRWKSISELFRIFIHRLFALSFPSYPVSLPDSSKHSDARLESQASRATTFDLKRASTSVRAALELVKELTGDDRDETAVRRVKQAIRPTGHDVSASLRIIFRLHVVP